MAETGQKEANDYLIFLVHRFVVLREASRIELRRIAKPKLQRICSPPCSDERWAGWLNTADEGLRERVAMLC